MASKRLNAERLEMSKVPDSEGMKASPVNTDNLAHWMAEIVGPKSTPYEGGHFLLEINFTSHYPFRPPQVLWKTKIYHPNISSSGHICISTLTEEHWSPAITVRTLLVSLQSLLSEPNPSDPLIPSIGLEFSMDRAVFERKAIKWTSTYASKERQHSCMLVT